MAPPRLLLLLAAAALLGCARAATGTGGLSRAAFPKGFVFGTATSAFQVEGMATGGGRGPSIWDPFVHTPGNIAENANADVATDEYHRYKEDVDLLKSLNFDAYRFSISWSRIFPDGEGKVNKEGVTYYNNLIDYVIKQGLTPYVNLNHYDIPLALQKKYDGFLSPKIVNIFADYAEFCFKTYGDRIKNWFTFNEPRIVAALGFDTGTNPPNRCTKCAAGGNSATEPYTVVHNILLCHATAVARYRNKYQASQKGKVGIVLDFNWYDAATDSPADKAAAQRARDFHVGWFLDPLLNGQYPKTMQDIVKERLPSFTPEQSKLVKGSVDYIGINQYTATYMADQPTLQQPPTSYSSDWHVQYIFQRNGVPIGQKANSNWLYIVPTGMYGCVNYIREKYNNPTIIISENGMDQPANLTREEFLHDASRVEFYKTYLAELKKAIDDGANVVGYFAWSLLDNFEWLSGYTSKFGIVYVDFTTLKRYPKDSAYWFPFLWSSSDRIQASVAFGVLVSSRSFSQDPPMAPLGDAVAPAAAAAPGLVVSFGEMLIDFVPDVAGVSLAESGGFVKAPGGAPANVACAVSKLGGSSAFVGKFGDDEFGHMLVEILKQNGVNAEGCLFDQHARTALAFVTLKANGEREFMFYRNPSADMLLTEAELNLDLIRRARIFHYGSISLITEPCRSAHVAAMRAAKSAGILCSYDPNVRLPLWPSAQAARDGIMSIWKEADFIKVSDDEVAFLTQGDANDEKNVLSLWFEGLKLLIVTDGEKGCRYFTKDFKGSVPGYSVNTVDTTGAGDAFVGSLLVNVSKDDSIFYNEAKLREVLQFSNACGAICTTKKGAIPALPTTATALELISKGSN